MKKTKYRVSQSGIFGAMGEIAVGTEFETSGEIPAGWKDKVQELGSAEATELTTNPAGDLEDAAKEAAAKEAAQAAAAEAKAKADAEAAEAAKKK